MICRQDELHARYAHNAVRLSVFWKAEVVLDPATQDSANMLSEDQVVRILDEDLACRGVRARLPTEPLHDPTWIALVYQTYTRLAKAAAARADG